MAEEKKSDKKPDKKPTGAVGPVTDSDATERIVGILVMLLLLGMLATAITNFIDNIGLYGAADSWLGRITGYFLENIWPKWKFAAVVVSGLAIAGIIYNYAKLAAINAAEALIFTPSPAAGLFAAGEVPAESKNSRWEQILKYANSSAESDWKLAILEADAMLEDVLRAAGYPGETVADMLKSARQEDFLSLEEAWEAHKIRNRVAHSTASFQLNERETKRVIALFEKVFLEFGVI